jgi:uncharacterized membrane protein
MVKIGRDKIKHFFAGLAIAIVAGLLFCPRIGLAIAAVVGALKESIWDWLLKKGTPELLDFVATVAGGVIGYVLIGWL